MKKIFLPILFLSLPIFSIAQFTFYNITELASMPERVSNNAVAEGFVNGLPYVYSFGGIDSTKSHSGIHLKSYKYDYTNDVWSTLPPLPDTLGKIAAGASTVKNKIYIIGGYHVYANGSEKSSNAVHVFNPETDNFMFDAAPVPVPIDDHVQAVWRDSLIYVITGWSDNTNVGNVQIFNPSTYVWSVGTPVPNNANHKVFGASGVIIGDTIYYSGGARYASNFPTSIYFRKGIIDPTNPTNITWITEPSANAIGYRMAAVQLIDNAIWFGGSTTTYNYDGIAYNGSGGVSPENRIIQFNPINQSLDSYSDVNYPAVMDLRGAAKISQNGAIIAGGMIENQEVTNKTYHIFAAPISTNEQAVLELQIYPNPATDFINIQGISFGNIQIINTLGQLISSNTFANSERIPVYHLPKGNYQILVESEGKKYVGTIVKR